MAWFADLSPCDYFGSDAASSLKAIGWLECGREFRTGIVERRIYDTLVALCHEPWQPTVALGIHGCQLCRYEPFASNGANVFIPGNGFLYVCPALITHYMNAHGYLPPEEFCSAALACPAMRSLDYMKALLENGGRRLIPTSRH